MLHQSASLPPDSPPTSAAEPSSGSHAYGATWIIGSILTLAIHSTNLGTSFASGYPQVTPRKYSSESCVPQHLSWSWKGETSNPGRETRSIARRSPTQRRTICPSAQSAKFKKTEKLLDFLLCKLRSWQRWGKCLETQTWPSKWPSCHKASITLSTQSFQLHPTHILTAGQLLGFKQRWGCSIGPENKQRGHHPKRRVQLGNRFLQACSTVAASPHSFQENPMYMWVVW